MAMRTGVAILMDDLAVDRRFERYSPRAFALGVRSSLSLPLTGGHQAAGALNLYARHIGGFGAVEQADAHLFAGDVSRALNLAIRLAYQVEMTEELRAALKSRTLVDQTLGIIMSQRVCDADAAMAILRADSLDRDVEPLVRAAQSLRAGSTPPWQRRGSGPELTGTRAVKATWPLMRPSRSDSYGAPDRQQMASALLCR